MPPSCRCRYTPLFFSRFVASFLFIFLVATVYRCDIKRELPTMLSSSFTIRRVAAASADGGSKGAGDAAVEQLSQVEFCSAVPVVVERWRDCHTPSPYVALSGGQKVSLTGVAADAVDGTPRIWGSSPVEMQRLIQSYMSAGDAGVDRPFLYVYPTGQHRFLSTEAKAALVGAMLHSFRHALWKLLQKEQECCTTRGDAETRETSAILQRCCRVQKALSGDATNDTDGGAPAPPSLPPSSFIGESLEVQWKAELLLCVAGYLSEAIARPGSDGNEGKGIVSPWQSLFVEEPHDRHWSAAFGDAVARRLQSDAAISSTPPASHRAAPPPSQLQLTLTSCRAVEQSSADIFLVVRIVRTLLDSYVRAAAEQLERGTGLFPMLSSADPSHGRDGAEERERDADDVGDLQSLAQQCSALYRKAAAIAQQGALFLYQHEWAAGGHHSRLEPLTAAEEESRRSIGACPGQAAMIKRLFAPMRVPGSPGLFQDVLLSVDLHPSATAASSAPADLLSTAAKLQEDVYSDAATQPGQDAMRWRERCRGDGCSSDDGSRHPQLPATTALQVLLYTLRRQLVVAISNGSQVILSFNKSSRRAEGQPPSSSGAAESLWDAADTRWYAVACEKSLTLVFDLLRWHCPYERQPQKAATSDARGATELHRLLLLYVKLSLRSAALYQTCGDEASARRRLSLLKDTLKRWQRRRERPAATLDQDWWGGPVEDVVRHLSAESFHRLMSEASGSIASMVTIRPSSKLE